MNLPEEKQQDFDKLVSQYKNDLYTKAYMDALVNKSINTNVTLDEAREVYENNRETFKLNEELVKFRYVSLPQNALNSKDVERRFRRYNEERNNFV